MAETEYESLEGLFESESEFAERRPIPRPSAKPSFQRRVPPSYVTQVQLEAALARVDGKVKTVADGVSTLSSRVNTLVTNIKKEAEERKKESQAQKSDLNQKLQMLALLPLLVKPSSGSSAAAITDASGNPVPGNKVLIPDTSTLTAVLPFLLVSGLGTSSGGISLGGDSGSDNGMLLMALVLAFANK
jgi:hypothetical protein